MENLNKAAAKLLEEQQKRDLEYKESSLLDKLKKCLKGPGEKFGWQLIKDGKETYVFTYYETYRGIGGGKNYIDEDYIFVEDELLMFKNIKTEHGEISKDREQQIKEIFFEKYESLSFTFGWQNRLIEKGWSIKKMDEKDIKLLINHLETKEEDSFSPSPIM